jgi:hypothetical protein
MVAAAPVINLAEIGHDVADVRAVQACGVQAEGRAEEQQVPAHKTPIPPVL